jgi:ubiquinone/menaquinone biosynthesis C-methylase UbiE
MDPHKISSHIQTYYSALFAGANQCRLSVLSGRALAASLGYPIEKLSFIPDTLWTHVLPCGNPLPLITPLANDFILNLGCGAGLDSFSLSLTTKPSIRVVGLDVVRTVMVDAREAYSRAGSGREEMLSWVCGDGMNTPFRDESFHWIILNGVFNLFPEKEALLDELTRILQPGGRLIAVDLCAADPLPDEFAEELDSWAWCMSGAMIMESLSDLLAQKGFNERKIWIEEEGGLFHRLAFTCRKWG